MKYNIYRLIYYKNLQNNMLLLSRQNRSTAPFIAGRPFALWLKTVDRPYFIGRPVDVFSVFIYTYASFFPSTLFHFLLKLFFYPKSQTLVSYFQFPNLKSSNNDSSSKEIQERSNLWNFISYHLRQKMASKYNCCNKMESDDKLQVSSRLFHQIWWFHGLWSSEVSQKFQHYSIDRFFRK